MVHGEWTSPPLVIIVAVTQSTNPPALVDRGHRGGSDPVGDFLRVIISYYSQFTMLTLHLDMTCINMQSVIKIVIGLFEWGGGGGGLRDISLCVGTRDFEDIFFV